MEQPERSEVQSDVVTELLQPVGQLQREVLIYLSRIVESLVHRDEQPGQTKIFCLLIFCVKNGFYSCIFHDLFTAKTNKTKYCIGSAQHREIKTEKNLIECVYSLELTGACGRRRRWRRW